MIGLFMQRNFIRRDLFLLVAIRKPWFYHGLYGQDSL